MALRWFAMHAGQETSWPGSLSDGTLLASKAKGIYKPGWTKYALSVRESLGGPYSDRDPKLRPNGTWFYDYYQENTDPDQRDSEYTNVKGVDVQRLCQGNGPAIMSVVAVSSQ